MQHFCTEPIGVQERGSGLAEVFESPAQPADVLRNQGSRISSAAYSFQMSAPV